MIHHLTFSNIQQIIPRFGRITHKGTRGRVLIIGGSPGMFGAAIFAAKSALRSGSGLVYVAMEKRFLPLINAANPEIIFLPVENNNYLELIKKYNFEVIVIGPGLTTGEKKIKSIQNLLLNLSAYKSNQKVLIDAGGLAALRKIYRPLKLDLVITPHMREMSRLTRRPISKIKDAPFLYANLISKKYNCTVVLKDHISFITKNNLKFLNTNGNQGLAKGGSGDILSGMIASFMGQGKNSLDSALIGTFLHGLTANYTGKTISLDSFLPTDLIQNISHTHKIVKGY